MNSIRNLTILLAALFTQVGSAAELEKLFLKTKSEVEVHLEYRIEKVITGIYKDLTSSAYANPLFFLVKHSQLRSSDRLRIVIINREYHQKSCMNQFYTLSPNYVIDLAYSKSKRGFIGNFGLAKILIDGAEVPLQSKGQRLSRFRSGYCQTTDIKTELALVINGQWQTDPVNGTPNFILNLSPK